MLPLHEILKTASIISFARNEIVFLIHTHAGRLDHNERDERYDRGSKLSIAGQADGC